MGDVDSMKHFIGRKSFGVPGRPGRDHNQVGTILSNKMGGA
jgi:hypothetical protein